MFYILEHGMLCFLHKALMLCIIALYVLLSRARYLCFQARYAMHSVALYAMLSRARFVMFL